mgnify:CR=1 FL=1
MSQNAYDKGRLNLPFVGISTFGKAPYVADWDAIDADVAVMGAPFDFGTQFRAGARFGPRGIREASTLFSFGHGGAYDHEDDVTYLQTDRVRMVDIGDADIVHTDTEKSHANIAYGVRKILAAGALHSPRLLLGSCGVHPAGCANSSGWVGRGLMFHLTELIALWPRRGSPSVGATRCLSLRDFYTYRGNRLGLVQSMGVKADAGVIASHLKGMIDQSVLRRIPGIGKVATV